MRVLVVEDDEAAGAVLRDFLLELGHEPLLVRSAEAALARLRPDGPDAILLDLHLPGLGGLEFLRSPAVRRSGVPVVVISGVATETQARECLALGAFDFLGKPVALPRLGEVLAALEPHALHRQLARVGRSPERRRGVRVPVMLPVRIVEYRGGEWSGWASDVSAFGMKVQDDAALEPGQSVKLTFALPDGGPPVRVTSLVLRGDRTGHAFYFVNLTADDFDRLGEFTRRHLTV
jgi:CheY-like chemotaxis protein